MRTHELYLICILIFSFVGFVSLISWFLFIGPQRRVKKILASDPGQDRYHPSFKSANPDWEFIRILPRKGLETYWDIFTNHGKRVAEIFIGRKRPMPGHQVLIGSEKFYFSKNVNGFTQDGFVIHIPEKKLTLAGDPDSGLLNTLKHNFRNLALNIDNNHYKVSGESDGKSIALFRNGSRVGIATIRDGSNPRFATISADATNLEKAILFYCSLL